MSGTVGDCAGNKVGAGVVSASVVKLRHLLGVEEIRDIGEGVSQATTSQKLFELLKSCVCGSIWEVGDEANVVCNNEDGGFGGVGSSDNSLRGIICINHSGSHLWDKVAGECRVFRLVKKMKMEKKVFEFERDFVKLLSVWVGNMVYTGRILKRFSKLKTVM